MKTTTTLPISKNSYKRFVEYINTVFAGDPNCGRIVKALDRYLEGDRDFYVDRLPREYRMAFQMLLFEVEVAISRSDKARRRALERKNRAETTETVETTDAVETVEKTDAVETDVVEGNSSSEIHNPIPEQPTIESTHEQPTIESTHEQPTIESTPIQPEKGAKKPAKPTGPQPYQIDRRKKKFTIRKIKQRQ